MTNSNEFQFFWYGGPLDWISEICLRSFTRFSGVNVHLYSYDRDLNPGIPGCVCHDASEFLPREIAATWNASRGEVGLAAVASLFRYKLLYEKGGWYFDVDCLLTRPLTPLFDLDYVFAWENSTQVNNAVIKFPKGNEMLDQLYNECVQVDPKTWQPGSFVPLFTEYLKKFNLIGEALPRDYFYPIFPWEVRHVADEAESTFIVHLYASRRRHILPPGESSVQNQIRSLENQINILNNSLSLKIGRNIPFGRAIRRALMRNE